MGAFPPTLDLQVTPSVLQMHTMIMHAFCAFIMSALLHLSMQKEIPDGLVRLCIAFSVLPLMWHWQSCHLVPNRNSHL